MDQNPFTICLCYYFHSGNSWLAEKAKDNDRWYHFFAGWDIVWIAIGRNVRDTRTLGSPRVRWVNLRALEALSQRRNFYLLERSAYCWGSSRTIAWKMGLGPCRCKYRNNLAIILSLDSNLGCFGWCEGWCDTGKARGARNTEGEYWSSWFAVIGDNERTGIAKQILLAEILSHYNWSNFLHISYLRWIAGKSLQDRIDYWLNRSLHPLVHI